MKRLTAFLWREKKNKGKSKQNYFPLGKKKKEKRTLITLKGTLSTSF